MVWPKCLLHRAFVTATMTAWSAAEFASRSCKFTPCPSGPRRSQVCCAYCFLWLWLLQCSPRRAHPYYTPAATPRHPPIPCSTILDCPLPTRDPTTTSHTYVRPALPWFRHIHSHADRARPLAVSPKNPVPAVRLSDSDPVLHLPPAHLGCRTGFCRTLPSLRCTTRRPRPCPRSTVDFVHI